MRLSEAPPLNDVAVQSLIAAALEEDLGGADITTEAVVGEGETCLARIKAKGSGVLAGVKVAEAVFRTVDPNIDFELVASDGSHVSPGDHIAIVGGDARAILSAERTALNFLQHLSGVASATADAVAAVAGTGVRILDTRKTTPGFRELEKYAVTLGGGLNHRHGLFDAFLIKNNHIAAAGGLSRAVASARAARPDQPIEVEVRDFDQLQEAIAAGPARILLDNFTPALAGEAVRMIAGRAETEISGGVTRENLIAFAAAHPDFISLGYITHSAPVVDIALRLVS